MSDSLSDIFIHPDLILIDPQFNTITKPESSTETITITNDSHAITNTDNSQPMFACR